MEPTAEDLKQFAKEEPKAEEPPPEVGDLGDLGGCGGNVWYTDQPGVLFWGWFIMIVLPTLSH